ncbi:type II toxin-antitoxin system ParD family antitoxin [Sphingomonas sp. DT-51]|jgi:antitoxin ParD1/3/4|uniref:type II toxin-antitoxin system ParD family antitoxin n=1 Tax=Sphingomonas sp. DT-51 TaxID=3396165 RepID=UPI003F1B4669
MARRLIRTVSLSQELDRFVADEVASGHYATASEVVRAGLRTLIEQQRTRQPASQQVGH